MVKKKKKEIKFSLLGNGLDFIISALEHIKDPQTERKIKYSVLHLSSGIELVLKERLRREHWALVFNEPAKANLKAYEAGDFTSVNFKDCIKRLIDICGVDILSDHQKELLIFRTKRNRFEHFGVVDSAKAIISSSAKALNFLIDFINKELSDELAEEENELIEDIRRKLSDFSLFTTERLHEINKKLEENETVVECPRCAQKVLVLSEGANCLFCGYKQEANEAANEYINEILGVDHYTTIKDGGEYPLYICPECESETLVDCGDSGSQYPNDRCFVCFDCGFSRGEGVLDFCTNCGRPFDPGDDGMAICDRCFKYKVEND